MLIDSLYLSDIKAEVDAIDKKNWETDIRSRIFPYTKTPFTLFEFNDLISPKELGPHNIMRANNETDEPSRCFSTDTGLLVVFRTDFLFELISYLDYDELVDTPDVSGINVKYWDAIEDEFEKECCGLILSPGVDSGFDFEGSGLFKLVL